MPQPSERTLRKTISRTLAEIQEIEEAFYEHVDAADLPNRAWMLGLRRKNAIRRAVLELHTSIEHLFTHWLKARLLGIRLPVDNPQVFRGGTGRLMDDLLEGPGSIGFERKLKLMLALRMIRKSLYVRLMLLNMLRNRCSHNWELRRPIRRGKRPRQLKPPLLQYEGGSLFDMAVFNRFLSEFSSLYLMVYHKAHS